MIYIRRIGKESPEFEGWYFANIQITKMNAACGLRKTKIMAFVGAVESLIRMSINKFR